jgi:mannan endo-1,4-beta-mannosidase
VTLSKRSSRRHQPLGPASTRPRRRFRPGPLVVGLVCVVVLAGGFAAVFGIASRAHDVHRSERQPANWASPSTAPDSYVGVYVPGSPASYAGLKSFAKATGVKPNLALYYSSWYEQFWTSFAKAAALHGAIPLVQINPTGISLAAIASGRYDTYLRSYAGAVRSYRHPVVMSFGHEMNGRWYQWGLHHTSPAVFVAAWRHIVRVFRSVGARNVTWMWTINRVDPTGYTTRAPAAWWPGSSYVDWVGIDGYFHTPSDQFASVFGPTIVDVRELTNDPILISETGAATRSGQPAKIASLFAGVHAYGLLGFVWFDDAVGSGDYRVTSPGDFAAFRRGAKTFGER